MAKKKVVKKEVKKQEEDCGCAILIGLGILLVGGLLYLGYRHFFTPKFAADACLLNRSGETLQVDFVGEENYYLYKMKYEIDSLGDKYYTYKETNEYVVKDKNFVDEFYIEVPCTR